MLARFGFCRWSMGLGYSSETYISTSKPTDPCRTIYQLHDFLWKKCNVSTINTHRSCLAPNLAISCDELKPKYWEPCDPKLPELTMHGNKLPSLKLTASLPLKMDAWKMKCPFGARPMFRGYVSIREGRPLKSPCQEIWPIFRWETKPGKADSYRYLSVGILMLSLRLEWYQTLLWNACMTLAQ